MFYVLWEHLVKLEMNLMSMKCPKTFFIKKNNVFLLFKGLSKDSKWFEDVIFMCAFAL